MVSTSANPSGEPPPVPRRGALDPELLSRVDLVLDGGPTPGGSPAPWSPATALRLVREGVIPWVEVLDAPAA